MTSIDSFLLVVQFSGPMILWIVAGTTIAFVRPRKERLSGTLGLVLIVATHVACGQRPPESWSEAQKISIGTPIPNQPTGCEIVVGDSWDDALPCLNRNWYTVPRREGRRVSHSQVTPDTFIDIWEGYEASFARQRVRLTFERSSNSPYRLVRIEKGESYFDESG